MPRRPEIPVAAIVSRAARENIAATADNLHYRESQYPAGPVVDGEVSSAANGSASSSAKPMIPPYTPFAEGAPVGDPMAHIPATHTPSVAAPDIRPSGSSSNGMRQQVWLKCAGGHEWGTAVAAGQYDYAYCGRCGQKGEVR